MPELDLLLGGVLVLNLTHVHLFDGAAAAAAADDDDDDDDEPSRVGVFHSNA